MAQASSGDDASRIIGFNWFEKKRKGDTSNEGRRGTFLKWVDTRRRAP